MANAADVLGPVFTSLLVIILLLMVFHTYALTRRPVLRHLREIYFINSASFKRAWYLVISGMTFFVFARGLQEGERLGRLHLEEGVPELFLVLFAAPIFAAFLELVFVFERYIPNLGADDPDIESLIRRHLRHSVLTRDDEEEIHFSMPRTEDIYRGRPGLGPHVHLSHYRGVVLGMTRYLEQRFGQLGDALLHAVGRQTGRMAAADILRESRDPGMVVDEFLRQIRTAMVGMPEVLVRTPTRLRVRITECAACSGNEPSGGPECHYLTGLFSGLFETLTGNPVEAQESRCWAKGDTYCEFDVDALPEGQRERAAAPA